jgi:DNA-directed RNA polymerase specialized sigma24 family protein
MVRPELDERLSRISTFWTMVHEAHDDPADAKQAAQNLLLERYSGAAYRYLLGAVRDPDVATELFQDFALRFLRGDFRRADPRRGRFRDYVKTALIHLVTDYHRSKQAWPGRLADDPPDRPPPALEEGLEENFLASWREELLGRTWHSLAEANPAYHAVLLCRVENADMPSGRIAQELCASLDKPLTASWVRKNLQRAHEKFADLLLDEVARSLESSRPEDLRDELGELDLFKYCQSAVARRGGG